MRMVTPALPASQLEESFSAREEQDKGCQRNDGGDDEHGRKASLSLLDVQSQKRKRNKKTKKVRAVAAVDSSEGEGEGEGESKSEVEDEAEATQIPSEVAVAALDGDGELEETWLIILLDLESLRRILKPQNLFRKPPIQPY